MPTTREPAVDGVSAEWSSAPCTAAEVELIVHLGLLDMEGDLNDWETELEYEMPPLLSPSSPLVPSSPEGASDSPVPAPCRRPPVPAPRQRPPVPAPRQRPPVPAPPSSPKPLLVPSSSALPERPWGGGGWVMSRPWTVLCVCSTCSVTQFLPNTR